MQIFVVFMNNLFKYFFVIFLFSILNYSCRMDIVEPEPIDIALNQPIQENRLNYLNYELNAQNFSFTTSIHLNFSVQKATLFLTIISHTGGNVQIEIKDITRSTVFKTELWDNLPSFVRTINEPDQASIIISSKDFSGKLRLRLTSVVE